MREEDVPGAADVSWSYGSANTPLNVTGQAVTRRVAQSTIPYEHPREVIVRDRLGRVVRTKVTSFSGDYILTDFYYDHLGQLSLVSVPYASTERAPGRYYEYAYDHRGRLVYSARPKSMGRKIQHDRLTTHTWDEVGNHSYFLHDTLGRLIKSVDIEPSGREIATQYQYGPFDQLELVIDARGNHTSIEYDELGRPEKLIDPDSGMNITNFNPFGEVKRTVNGAGEETIYRRDSLGRILQAVRPDGTDAFVWDSATMGVGQLASTQSADGISTAYT